jgi:hypothetical protein
MAFKAQKKRGIHMRNYLKPVASIFICLLLVISLISCSPKRVVRGRVVDAATQQPIKGAAVAIRWYTDYPDKQSAKSGTVDAAQAISDAKGVFKLPEYPEKKYILGVYKNGYICWSSKDIFAVEPSLARAEKYRKRKHHRIEEGMQIKLEPFRRTHPKEMHAGFTVMVAGESTDSDGGPFHQAIQTEYQLWRENLRKDFQKQVGAQ